ncbi:MAG: extracellular solute-binding protein [Acidobacteriota bacterium]
MNQRGFAIPVQCRTLFTTALFALCLSVGCRAATTYPTPAPLPRDALQTPVAITFWHTQIGPARAQLNQFAGDFTKIYPSIKVRGDAKSNDGDLLRQGIAALALDQMPDLIIASPRTIAEFARRNALVNLDPFLEDAALGWKGEDRSDLFPGALDTGRFAEFDNRLLAFPFDEHAVVLYYNADLLRAAQLNAPRTWDEFSAAARSTTRDAARGWVMVADPFVFYAFVFSRGGSVLNDNQSEAQFNGEAGLKSLQMIAALTNGGSAYLASTPENARLDFAEGKAAFLFESSQDLDAVAAAVGKAGSKFQWGISNIPQDRLDPAFTALDSSSLAIFNTSPERERDAWLFMRWLGMPEQSARWSSASLGLPVRLSARALLAANSPANSPLASIDNLIDPLPTGRGVPTVKDAASIDQAIVDMWTAVATNTDAAAALSRAVTRVSRVLGQK